MAEKITLGMSELSFTNGTATLGIIGLGSCVGLVLYHNQGTVCAMAHIMLPNSREGLPRDANPGRFADTAIAYMVRKFAQEGIKAKDLAAKMAGGASMFKKIEKGKLNIGQRNIAAIRKALKAYNIPVVAEDVGRDYGRTIEFDASSKQLQVKSYRYGMSVI